MSINKQLRGTGVALVTPFHKDGRVDFTCLTKLINYVISNSVEYLVLMGTTGESAVLSSDEQNALIDFTIEAVNNRVPLVIGIGGNNTMGIVDKIHNSRLEAFAALLSVSPYYNRPSQEGIYQHFKAISEASPIPVIIYNVPSRTASNISAETTLRLAVDCQNIIAIKEASGDILQIMNIINYKPDNFMVISGDDILTLPIIAFGGHGVISVTANAFPLELGRMVRAALKKQMDEANELHYSLLDIMKALFKEGSPAGIKTALATRSICHNYLRLPLTPVSKKIEKEIIFLVQNFQSKETAKIV